MATANLLRERLAETITRGWSELEFASISVLTVVESNLPVPPPRQSSEDDERHGPRSPFDYPL